MAKANCLPSAVWMRNPKDWALSWGVAKGVTSMPASWRGPSSTQLSTPSKEGCMASSVPWEANTGMPYFLANTRTPAMWSLCSWVMRMP